MAEAPGPSKESLQATRKAADKEAQDIAVPPTPTTVGEVLSEASSATLNPAYYPAETKPEAMRSEDEKQALKDELKDQPAPADKKV